MNPIAIIAAIVLGWIFYAENIDDQERAEAAAHAEANQLEETPQ